MQPACSSNEELEAGLRAIVNEAEAAEPGGLDGGPGNLRAKEVFQHLENRVRAAADELHTSTTQRRPRPHARRPDAL